MSNVNATQTPAHTICERKEPTLNGEEASNNNNGVALAATPPSTSTTVQKKKGLQLMSLSDIIAAPKRLPNWIVEPLFTKGDKVLIYGDPGCRKSWMGLDMGLHLAAGQAWLEHFKVPQGPLKVLYIDEEMPQDLLEARIQRLYEGYEGKLDAALPNFKAVSHYRVKLTDIRMKQFYKELEAENFIPDVLIFESMRQIVAGSEKDETVISAMWQSLDPFCHDGRTVALTHHMKKPVADSHMDPMYMASGSGYIIGGSDDAMAVTAKGTDVSSVDPFRVRAAGAAPPFMFRLEAATDGTGPAKLLYVDHSNAPVINEAVKATNLLKEYIWKHNCIWQSGTAEKHLRSPEVGISESTAKRAIADAREISGDPINRPEGETTIKSKKGWYRYPVPPPVEPAEPVEPS